MHTLSPEERRQRILQAIDDLSTRPAPEARRLLRQLRHELEAQEAGQRELQICQGKTLDWLNKIKSPQQLLAEIRQDPLNAYGGHPRLANIQIAQEILHLRDQAPDHQLADLEPLRHLGGDVDTVIDDLLYTGCLGEESPPLPPPNVGILLPVRLETRFYPPSDGSEWLLRVLVVPDEPSIDRHDPIPFEAELESVEWLWQQSRGVLDTDAGRIAWQQFANRHGGARAAWLARTFPPLPPDNEGVIHVKRPQQTRTEPYFGHLSGFPQEIEFWMGRSGQPPVRVARSSVNVDALLLDFPDPEDQNDTRWWSSWKRAREVGLGIEIAIGSARPEDIDVLYVIGLGEEDPAELFRNHRDSGALGLIGPGTPTNTVDGAPAADLARDPETWRRIALQPNVVGRNGGQVSRALTGKPNLLGALPGDDFLHQEPGQAMVTALWPVLWGHALKDIWDKGDDVFTVGLWAGQYLMPEGPLPPIRVNDQPYGLLPVTTLKHWKASASDGDFARIEEAMRPSLIAARAIWAEAATSSGNVTNADTERLLTLLGRTSSSNAYAYRSFISLELLQLLYQAYGSQLDWLSLLQWWEQASAGLKSFPITPTRRYVSIGWPQDLRIPLVAPPEVPASTLLQEYLQNFIKPDHLYTMSSGFWLDVGNNKPSDMFPDSLLARLLLHARFVTSAEVYRATHGTSGPALEPIATDEKRLTQLATWAAGMTNNDLNADVPAVHLYRAVQQAIKVLLAIPVGVLDRIMRATLDTAAYRIDPWINAFAWRRLEASVATNRPFQLGIYGWVDEPKPGTPGPTEGGLLHAPSHEQAITATILRDKAIHDPDPGRWQMNLESNTIRLAQRFAEEVRLGSHIQEVLGREIERIVGSKATVESLRTAFPLRTEHNGRRVCNGEAVLKADLSTLPLNNVQKKALEPLRRALDTYGDLLVAEAVYHVVSGRGAVAGAAMDAAAGLAAPPNMEVISTRRTGRGVNTNVVVLLPNAVTPAVKFDASPGEIADPAVADFLRTTIGQGNKVPWRWQVILPDGSTDEIFLSDTGLVPIDTVMLSEEELARLVLEACPHGSVLNTRWQIILPDGTAQSVLLSDLDVKPNDIISLSETALAKRMLSVAPAGSKLEAIESPEGLEAQRRARRIMNILGRQPAVPEDLLDTAVSQSNKAVSSDLIARYKRVHDTATLLSAELQDALTWGDMARLRRGAVLAARWGITPVQQAGDTLNVRATQARAALEERIKRSPAPSDIAALSADELAKAIAELTAPEGQMVVLSRINLKNWPTSFTAASTLDHEWLTLNAAVREPLARLEAHQMETLLSGLGSPLSAWTNRPADPWQVSVLPTPNGARPATRLIAVYGPAGVIAADPASLTTVAAGLLDSWGETIPDVEQTTTAAFGFNAPGARAPQAILVAVPPVEEDVLTLPILVDILAETRELARARMATPDELHTFDGALPAVMLPASGATDVRLEPKP